MGILAILAFLVRMLPWRNATAGGDFLFSQADAYYHLRRVELLLHSFPRTQGIDHYLSYPYGSECPWPPLYDLFQAGLAILAGGLNPSGAVVRGVNSLLPPIMAAATIFLVHHLARRLGGRAAGFIAAGIFVAVPIHLQYSLIGSGDHHTAEVLLLAALLCAFPRESTQRVGAWMRGKAILSGLILGAAVLIWQGSIVFGGVVVAGVLALVVATATRKDCRPLREEAVYVADNAIIALATSVVIVAAARMVFPSDSAQTRFDFGFFSWFQPAVLLCGTIAAFVLKRALMIRRAAPGRTLALAVTLIVIAAAAPAAIPVWRENLLAAARFLTATDPWLSTIIEFKPLSFKIFLKGWDSLRLGVLRIHLAMMLLPMVVAPLLLIKAWQRREPLLDQSLFLACAIIVGILALLQGRWANAHALNIAIAGGWVASASYAAARARIRAGSGRGFRKVLSIAAGFLPGALIFAPTVLLVVALWSHPQTLERFDRYAPLLWLKENTPRTAGLWGTGGRPEYAVLAPWSYGHMVQYLGERPTIVDNFGTQLRGNGIHDLARFYYAGSEEEITSLCDRRRIRYIVLFDPFPELQAMAPVIGIDFERDFTEPAIDPTRPTQRVLSRRLYALAAIRLYGADGTLSPSGPAFARFRLIHESPIVNPGSGEPESVKIFEFVRGATLNGSTRPRGSVTVACRLGTDAGRPFVYTAQAEADANGRFSILFPYATQGRNGGTVALAGAFASAGSRSVSFVVTEDAVLKGGVVTIPGTL